MRAVDVEIGDKLDGRRWNRAERYASNHVAVHCEVLDIACGQSQTGYLFKVRTPNGDRWLDAAWFGCKR